MSSISIGEDYPRQQARAREMLQVYRDLGHAGAFGAIMIERDIKEADEAAMSGDLARMIRAYAALKEIQ